MTFGFTGTSKHDMKPRQLKMVRQLLWKVDVLHLGDCVHADAQAHDEAVALGIKTVGHPPNEDYRRAFCIYDEERPPKPGRTFAESCLARNRDIALEGVDGLIAAPSGWVEELRSGTRATVRYARKLKRKIWIVLPDGKVKVE